jgi:hypothetical protein
MYTIHLDTLGIIHNFHCIAESINRQCLAYEMKIPDKTGGNGLVFPS